MDSLCTNSSLSTSGKIPVCSHSPTSLPFNKSVFSLITWYKAKKIRVWLNPFHCYFLSATIKSLMANGIAKLQPCVIIP